MPGDRKRARTRPERTSLGRPLTLVLCGLAALACGGEVEADGAHAGDEPCATDAAVPAPEGEPLARSAAGRGEWTGDIRWVELTPVPTPRIAYAAAAVRGRIHVVGGLGAGATHEIYDPADDTWYRAPELPVPMNHGWAAGVGGHLYVGGNREARVFCYDVERGAWTEVASSPFPHGGTPATAVIDVRIYLAGGRGGGMSGTELSTYDPASDRWTSLSPMACARHHTAGGAIEARMHVAGGRPGRQTCHEVYDPATDEWTRLPDLPTGREGMGGAVAGGIFFVMGGEGNPEDDDFLFAEVEAFHPETNTWIRLPDMPTPRHGIFATAIGDTLFMPGGGRRLEGVPTNDVLVLEREAR